MGLHPEGRFIAVLILFAAAASVASQTPSTQTPADTQQKHDVRWVDVFNGVGSVPQPKSYAAAEAEAEANALPAGYASMYILEPSKGFGVMINVQGPLAMCMDQIVIDGRSYWGLRPGGEYSWDPLTPGEHTFRWGRTSFTLNAEPGKTYYIRNPGRGKLEVISAEEGEKIRKTLKLNPGRWLLRQYDINWSKVQAGMKREDVERLIGVSPGTETVWAGTPFVDNISAPRITKVRFTSKTIGYVLEYENGVLTSKTAAPGNYFASCTATPWHAAPK